MAKKFITHTTQDITTVKDLLNLLSVFGDNVEVLGYSSDTGNYSRISEVSLHRAAEGVFIILRFDDSLIETLD